MIIYIHKLSGKYILSSNDLKTVLFGCSIIIFPPKYLITPTKAKSYATLPY